jgi:hypothetical protein
MKPIKIGSIRKVSQYILLSCVIFLGVISIIGTGGGGGDGGGGITYTGLTTQAEITDANAELFAAGAFGAGRTGSTFTAIGAVEKSSDGNISSFRTFSISQALKDAVLQVDLSSIASPPPFIGATESGTEPGPCGGTVSYSMQVNETTGVFSGTFTFKSYCDSGVVISGSTTVNGTINLDTLTPENIHFRFENLSDGSSTLRGDLDMDFTISPIRVDFDTYLKDNATNTVYWAHDYVIYITEGVDGIDNYLDVEINSGNYYEPDYGYVTISTPTPFRVYVSDLWPSEGVMVATGTGNTKVKLTAISNTQCQIDADLDGDDIYEQPPVTKDWQNL